MSNPVVAIEAGCHETVVQHLGPAQARWERLSVSDYARVETAGDLIASVARRYSLPDEQAKLDVLSWLREVGFGAGLLPMLRTR